MLPDHVNVPLVVPVVSLKVAGRTGVVKLKNSWLVEKSSLSSDKGLTELFWVTATSVLWSQSAGLRKSRKSILLLQQQIFLFKAQRIRAVTSHILQLRYILFCLYFRSKWPMLHTFVLSQKSIKVSEKKSWNKKTFFFCKKASVLHYFFIHMSRVFVNSKTSPTRMHFLYHFPFVSFSVIHMI